MYLWAADFMQFIKIISGYKPGKRINSFLDIFSGVGVYARPHPDPLPRGEGEHLTSLDNFSILIAFTDSVSFAVRHRITQPIAWLKTRRTIPPLLGERAGVGDVLLISWPYPKIPVFISHHPLKNIGEA